jgi:hypothetical protein
MNRSFEQLPENLTKAIVHLTGIGLAIFLGLSAGSGNFMQVGKFVFLVLALLYVLFLQNLTWKIIYFICTLGLNFIPGGIFFGASEITCAILFCLFAATWWRKEKPITPFETEKLPFRIFNVCLIAWITYNIIHMLYTIWDPYWAGDVAIKNLLKTYIQWAGLPIAVFYFMHFPQSLKIKEDFPKTMGKILLFCLLANLAIRTYALLSGRFGGDPTLTKVEFAQGMFYIPGIGATENPYVFRILGPMSILFCMTFLHSEWIKSQGPGQRWILLLCLGMSWIGTILGGGRASIPLAVFFILSVYIFRKKYGRLILMGITAIFMIGLANGLYHIGLMQHLPPMVLRSCAVIIINKGEDAKVLLRGSNEMREDIFKMAIAEWKSDSRIFWFGRSTYSYGYDDILDAQLRADGLLISGLRRGASHNLISDLLIIFGLVGFCLFMAMIFSYLWLMWGIYRYKFYQNVEPGVRSLALVAFLGTAGFVSYGLIAGGGMIDGFSLLIILSRIYAVNISQIQSAKSAESKTLPHIGRYWDAPNFHAKRAIS